MLTSYRFPEEHWKHLRTTNPMESRFAALRLRTDAAKGYKKVASVMALIWNMLLVAEQSSRKLAAPEKIMQVFLSIGSTDRLEAKGEEVLAVASSFYTLIDGTSSLLVSKPFVQKICE